MSIVNKNNPTKLLQTFTLTPIAAVLISILFSIAGLIGSIYSNEIKLSCPFTLLISDNFSCTEGIVSHYALSFWLSLFMAAILLGFRITNVKHKFDLMMEKIRDDIETAPTDDFMASLKTHYLDSISLSVNGCIEAQNILVGKDSKTKDEDEEKRKLIARDSLEQNIRRILDYLAKLLQKIDKKAHETYRSSIMLFVPFEEELQGITIEKITQLKVFGISPIPTFFGDAGTENLAGMLVGVNDLSTTTSDNGLDPNFPNGIALPVPKQMNSKNGHLNALLGAPIAYLDEKRKFSLVIDTQDLSLWFQTSNYPYQIKDEIIEHFKNGEGAHVGSFVSYRIDNIDKYPIGVLNIDTASVGMLQNRKSPLYFQTVLAIFSPMLGNLISKWFETH